MTPAAARLHRRGVGAGPTGIVLIVLAGLLAACSGTSLPFSKASDAPVGRTPPPVVVGAIVGLAAEQADAMYQALVSAGAARNLAVERTPAEHGHALAGAFEAVATQAGTAIRYRWTLTDPSGRVLHRIEETEAARASAGDAGAGIDSDVVRRIAAYTAESLSSRFSQLGFAARAAGLPPPVDHLAQAGPGAEHEIDYETLQGPPMVAAIDSAPVTGAPVPQERSHGAEIQPHPETAAAPASGSIRGVAVSGVKGAGRTGNGELAGALKRVLSEAGWPVEDRPGEGLLAIEGDVSVGIPSGKAQKVALRWTVKGPDGRVLGTVEQANDVPAGSLDAGWGQAAHYAARAAADGIFDLVDKLR